MLIAFTVLTSSSFVLAQEPSLQPIQNVLFEQEDVVARSYSKKYPIKRWENSTTDIDFFQSSYQVSLFSPTNGEDNERLWSQSKAIFSYGFAAIGIIALLPEDVSNWDKDQRLLNKWRDHAKLSPVWDRDKGFLNIVGHPYFGGVYYQVARKSGYRQWDSFLYSALMSTFYWEYGIEAFAEVPSIQDIFVTPILGWVYGEWAFNTEMNIRENENKLFGSLFFGEAALIFLDPVDSLSVGINQMFNKEIIKSGTSYLGIKNVPIGLNGNTEKQIQLNITLQLGDGRNYSPNSFPSKNKIKDPINTSIVGLSYGIGHILLDDVWQAEDNNVIEYSLGLYFSKKFSARLSYAKSQLKQLSAWTKTNISYENYSLDAQYYFNNHNNFRPYFTAGFGEMMWEKNVDLKTFQVNVGTGIHYKITNNIAIQLDWRHYHSYVTNTSEDAISGRLIYRFDHGDY